MLNLDPGKLGPDQKAMLGVVRACNELGKNFRDSSHTVHVCTGWVSLVDPTATEELTRRMLDSADTTFHPEWLRGLFADDAVRSAVPPLFVIAALIATCPPERNDTHGGSDYVDAAAKVLGQEGPLINDFTGWLRGSASPSKAREIEELLSRLADLGTSAKKLVDKMKEALQPRSEVKDEFLRAFEGARVDLLRSIDELLAHSKAFSVTPTKLVDLREFVEGDRFRVAVLGEFKRGKSTFVNAMIGRPGCVPAATKPSTSALIELRHSGTVRYSRRPCTPGSQYAPSNETEFRAGAGAAHTWTSGKDTPPESVVERIDRWRVEIPSDFLARTRLELVDTPGLGEDRARDFVAKQEAQRSDAAIVILNAEQIASLQELQLVQEMQSKAENLVLAINRADGVDEQEWPDLRAHVVDRLKKAGMSIPEERILFVSARRAEEAIKAGKSDIWVQRLRDVERVTVENILAHRGVRKARVLCRKAADVSQSTRASVGHVLASRKRSFDHLEEHEKLTREATAARVEAERAVASAAERLLDCGHAQRDLISAFDAALPAILQATKSEMDTWTSEHFELTSPKAHVEEVAGKARDSLLRKLEAWTRDEKNGAAALVTKGLFARLEELKADLKPLEHYLAASSGGERGDFIDELLLGSVGDAFGANLIDADAGTALIRVAVMTAVTVVVGYIVADIILYYILGVVSGFLNPALLAAALVAAVLGYTVMGRDGVKRWIRSKVFDSLESALEKPETRAKINESLSKAVGQVFTDVGRTFNIKAAALISEAVAQQRLLEQERVKLRQMHGDPAALSAEIRKLEAEAANVFRALDELDQHVARIQRELNVS